MGKATRDSLTDKQQLFVDHYLITLNATKSAIAAGYAEAQADVQGWQLLSNPKVSKQLRKLMARRAKKLELSGENVLREISKIAFSDIRAVMEWDAMGVKVKASHKVHSDAAAAIQSIEQHTSETDKSCNTTVKVKLHDKMRALELAGRHLGLWSKGDEGEPFKAMAMADLIALAREKLAEIDEKK